jgi:hypothetical protein
MMMMMECVGTQGNCTLQQINATSVKWYQVFTSSLPDFPELFMINYPRAKIKNSEHKSNHVLVQCDVETYQINIPNSIKKAHSFPLLTVTQGFLLSV